MWPFKKSNKPDPPPETGTPSENKTPGERPLHHYIFCHRALPQIFLANPKRIMERIHSPEQRDFIRAIWEMVCDDVDKSGDPEFDSNDITIQTKIISGMLAAMIIMPPPQKNTEAYMTAMILVEHPSITEPDEMIITPRYFTLEKGVRLTQSEGDAVTESTRTVLCEWTADGTHLNLGDGPSPTVEAFTNTISQRIQTNQTE